MKNKFLNSLYFNAERYRAKYNKKENLFCYNIDGMDYKKGEETLIVRGWGFSRDTQKPLEFVLPKTEGKALYFLRKEIEDVNYAYNIPKNEKLGFEIKISTKKRSSLNLVLKSSEGVALNIKIEKSKIGKFDNLKFMKNSLILLKNEGAREAVKRIKSQGKSIWNEYDLWIYKNEIYDLETINREIDGFKIHPKISIVVPVYNVAEEWLRKNIESVQNQFYQNWELCLADDCSPSPHIKRVLSEYVEKDERIKVVFREKNGHISEATNSAIELATGDYIGFMDNDDEMAPVALYEYVKLINENINAEFIYCDEDMIDMSGRRFNPFFKSSWNPKLLLGHNYITHFVVVKRDLLEKAGKLRSEVNGSQDYDFVLRATELTENIYHIPKILYHWRTIEGSVAENPEAKNYAYVSGQKALEDALKRRTIKGDVVIGESYGTYKINYYFPKKPFVSVIMVNRPGNESLSTKCLQSILELTEYEAYEIIAVNFDDSTILDINGRVHFVFNNANRTFDQLRNYAVKKSAGEYLIFLDSTVKPENKQWLNELVNETIDNNTGLVGGKILDNKKRVLNAGMWFEFDTQEVHYTHRGCQADNIGYYYRLVLPQNVFAVSDECMLIKKNIFEQIDGFSENLEFPLSAIDLCLKVDGIGKKIVWTPYAEVMQMKKRVEKLSEEDFDHFVNKWSEEMCSDPYTNPYLINNRI